MSSYICDFRTGALAVALCLGVFFALLPAKFAGAAVPPVGSPVAVQSLATYRIGNDQFYTSSNVITTLVSAAYSISITPSGTVSVPAYTLQGNEGDTLYSTFTLDNLGKKGYLTSKAVRILDQAGGNKRVYYTLTEVGLEALREAQELQEAIWKDIKKYAF